MKSVCSVECGKKVLVYYYVFGSALGGSEYLPLLFIAELQQRGCTITLALDGGSVQNYAHI